MKASIVMSFQQISRRCKAIKYDIRLTTYIIQNPIVALSTGLPRGLGISAVLSELRMKYFDLSLRRVEGVYYYARFVDDIIVFCSSRRSADMVMETAKAELYKLGLTLNDKSHIFGSPPSQIILFILDMLLIRLANR